MIQFDVYPRDVKVTENHRAVEMNSAFQTFTTDGQSLELCRVPVTVVGYIPECSMALTKCVPEPLLITNVPDAHIHGDGSFEFLPDVEGGVGPYEFTITPDPGVDGFEFNSGTGDLKRPPR